MTKTPMPTISQSEFDAKYKLVPIEVIFIPEHGAYYARYMKAPKQLHLLQYDSPGHPCFDWAEIVEQLATTTCEGGLINRFVSMKTLINNAGEDLMNRSNSSYYMKSFLDKLNRENFIQVARLVKERVTKDVWTPEVALAFGSVLKELNQ